jgi:hypothetical protein
MSSTDFETYYRAALSSTEQLYLRYFYDGKWKWDPSSLKKEDDCYCLVFEVNAGLHDLEYPDQSTGFRHLKNAFLILERTVGIKTSADCSLFALTAILRAYLLFLQHGRLSIASSFILHATRLASIKFDQSHAFVQALYNLWKLQLENSQLITQVTLCLYLTSATQILEPLAQAHILSQWSDVLEFQPTQPLPAQKDVGPIQTDKILPAKQYNLDDIDFDFAACSKLLEIYLIIIVGITRTKRWRIKYPARFFINIRQVEMLLTRLRIP